MNEKYKIAVMGATKVGKTVFFASYFHQVRDLKKGRYPIVIKDGRSQDKITSLITQLFEKREVVAGTSERMDFSFSIDVLRMDIELFDLPGGFTDDRRYWDDEGIRADLLSADAVLFFISGEDLIKNPLEALKVNRAFADAISEIRRHAEGDFQGRSDVPIWFIFTKGDTIPHVSIKTLKETIPALLKVAMASQEKGNWLAKNLYKKGQYVNVYKSQAMGTWPDANTPPADFEPIGVIEPMEEIIVAMLRSRQAYSETRGKLRWAVAVFVLAALFGGVWWYGRSDWNKLKASVQLEMEKGAYEQAVATLDRHKVPSFLAWLPAPLRGGSEPEALRGEVYKRHEAALYAPLVPELDKMDRRISPEANQAFLNAVKNVERYLAVPEFAEVAPTNHKRVRESAWYFYYNLGLMYDAGQGVEKDFQKAAEYHRKAAELGHAEAQNRLSVMYYQGDGVPRDYRQAAEWVRKAAEQGNASAQHNLGILYEEGQGVAQDYRQAAEWYRKAANQSDASAQCRLGLMYEFGQGVTRDYRQAVEWYRKAADQGDATAQCNLGVMYESGRGVTLDYRQAVTWYRKAADQGDARGQWNLGTMYESGRGVSRDDRQAVEWYRKAAERGDASGQAALGNMYYKGKGVEQDYRQAAEWYRKAAEQGNVVAQCNLGFMYELGQGVTRDYRQAMEWYRKAADQGNAMAQGYLGDMYRYGQGVTQDDRQAVEWYRKAADQGHASAQCNLGFMYEFGRGVAQDYRQAVDWYRKAANQGDARGQWHLGRMYEFGQGVTKDYRQAVEWYRKAANQEYASGQAALGVMYYSGNGVVQDQRQAAEWFRKAANQGDAFAQYCMGFIYEHGQGVVQDRRQAREWYRKAADQGDKDAKEALDRLR